jgi:hypothetical protein
MAQPAKYNKDAAEKVLTLISTTSRGLLSICTELKISKASVFDWIKEVDQTKTDDFANRYARAREEQADLLADEIIEIADDGAKDTKTIIGKNGQPVEVEDTEWTKRSQLRIDARKWIASKLKPKKYGDKIQNEHSGELKVTQITGMEIK